MILIVEDDRFILEGLILSLKDEGFELVSASSFKEASAVIEEKLNKMELILLDVTLPDGSGFDLFQMIREKSEVPILFLTAIDDEIHKVMALEQGADDYITKPFHIRELIARMRAVMRRYKGNETTLIRIGDNKIDLTRGKIWQNGQEVILTAMEYKLLLIFVNNRTQLLTRDQILDTLYDDLGEYVSDNTLTVYIKRLRDKLGTDFIETVRGIGYRLKGE
ncbi:MAG: response regulator transcription factor [Erysipelotrichaceae bacterium]|nr:response regulator transcription factor [Erysipelotrichaceae bacterium]